MCNARVSWAGAATGTAAAVVFFPGINPRSASASKSALNAFCDMMCPLRLWGSTHCGQGVAAREKRLCLEPVRDRIMSSIEVLKCMYHPNADPEIFDEVIHFLNAFRISKS